VRWPPAVAPVLVTSARGAPGPAAPCAGHRRTIVVLLAVLLIDDRQVGHPCRRTYNLAGVKQKMPSRLADGTRCAILDLRCCNHRFVFLGAPRSRRGASFIFGCFYRLIGRRPVMGTPVAMALTGGTIVLPRDPICQLIPCAFALRLALADALRLELMALPWHPLGLAAELFERFHFELCGAGT